MKWLKKLMEKELFLKFFFDEDHIGGYQELRNLEKENKLQDLLK